MVSSRSLQFSFSIIWTILYMNREGNDDPVLIPKKVEVIPLGYSNA